MDHFLPLFNVAKFFEWTMEMQQATAVLIYLTLLRYALLISLFYDECLFSFYMHFSMIKTVR